MEFKESYTFCCLTILTIFQYTSLVTAFRTGAPVSKCETMVPGHFLPERDATPCPFKTTVEVAKNMTMTGGQHIRMVLSSPKKGTTFKGFLIMVKKPGVKDMSYGEFLDQVDPKKTQGIACFGNKNSAMTHVYNTLKNEVNLIWVAPKDAEDQEYEVVVTFVESFWSVWDNQVYKEKIRIAKTLENESEDKTVRKEPPRKPESTASDEVSSPFMNIFSYLSSFLWS